MKENELRIGNLVSSNNITIMVTGISNSYIISKDGYSGTKIDNINPIKITDEFLLKFGFIEDEFCQNKFYKKHIESKVQLRSYKDCVFLDVNDEEYEISFGKIKYIHQLQNLYFALTNEELKLNL